MKQCPNDRRLFDLIEGGGRAQDRMHLARCAPCADRHRQMLRVNRLAARALADGPLPVSAPPVPRPASLLIPLAAAALLAIAWLGPWNAKVGEHDPASETIVASLSLENVGSALFGGDRAEATEATPDSDGAYLVAALQGEWPCERTETAMDPRCY